MILKKLCAAVVSFVALATVNFAYAALIHNEIEDAGLTVETSQRLTLGTTTIFGTLHNDDGADVYGFYWGGGEFSAGTQGSDFDTMLSIYDSAGNLLAFNDDLIENGRISFASINLPEGDYLLGITYYDNNYNGDIVGYSNFGIEGSYEMQLTPFGPAAVPEPHTLALLGLGLVSLAFRHRKNLT